MGKACKEVSAIGMQRVNDISWQTVVKKEPKDVVAIMPGSLKPYFYFV